jgi:hypothetical protein
VIVRCQGHRNRKSRDKRISQAGNELLASLITS